MGDDPTELTSPIKVVMFGSGPHLTHDAKRFLCRLEAHPDIALLSAFCQSESQTFWAVVTDLWRRRGILALPLLLAQYVSRSCRFLAQPRTELALNRQLQCLSNRIHFVADIHDPVVLEQVRSLAPDLGLIYGSPILKPRLFELPTYGTLGIHHGKVPEYRGNKTMFWAMYNGEETAGVTIQKVNAGLDSGDVVKAGDVTIGRRSQRAVWRDLEALGLDLYLQAILDLKAGTLQYQTQSGPKGRLYRNPTLSDILSFYWRWLKRRSARDM